MLRFKLQIDANIVKPSVPPEMLKTLIIMAQGSITNTKDLLGAILSQISILIDQKEVDLENLYLATQDGFMFPPNMPINNFIQSEDLQKNGMW